MANTGKETNSVLIPERQLLFKVANAVYGFLCSPITFRAALALIFLYIAIGLCFLRSWNTSDYWEHLAAIGAFARSIVNPDNPYTGSGNMTHLFTPYHLFWGIISHLTGVSPIHLSPLIGTINILLFGFACWLLATYIFENKTLSLTILLTLLFVWVDPWRWSSFYNFGLLPLTSVYPYWFAVPAALLLLCLYLDPRYRQAGWAITMSLASALIFLIHPITGTFLYFCLGIKILVAKNMTLRGRAAYVALLGVSVMLILLWPYYNVLKGVSASAHFANIGFESDFYQFYDRLPNRLWPLLLALPAIWQTARSKASDFLLLGLFGFGLVYILNFFTIRSAVLGRFIVFVILFLQMFLLRTVNQFLTRRTGKVVFLGFILLVFVLASAQLNSSFAQLSVLPHRSRQTGAVEPTLNQGPNMRIAKRFSELRRFINTDDVVLARLQESWLLPALVGCKVVAVAHANPFMIDYEKRKDLTKRFFAGELTRDETVKMLEQYNVSFVFLSASDTQVLLQLPCRVSPVWSKYGYTLYHLVGYS